MKRKIMLRSIKIFAVIFAVLSLSILFFNVAFPLKYRKYIDVYAKQNNLSRELVSSLIKTESRFNKDAVSPKGCKGLMQIMPSTGKWICERYFNDTFEEKMLFDPQMNIKIGTKYLAYLFEKYQDETTVLACYNAGEGNVQNWIANGDALEKTQIRYDETRNYVEKVQKNKKVYKFRVY